MASRLGMDEYARFLSDEYLESFLCQGGAAVKVAVVPDSTTGGQLAASVRDEAEQLGVGAVFLDAATTRIHLIQHLFFGVASELDWISFARLVVHGIAESSLGPQIGGRTSVADIAAVLDIDEMLVRTQIMKSLSNEVMKDYSLAKDFRIAMTQVCLSELQPQDFTEEGRAAILDWLRGDLRRISAVKDKHIFHKIGRHSARAMLSSTARWLAKAGSGGLVLVLDVGQLAVSRRPDVAEGTFYYSPAAVMDAFEVLRQFIDATDEMEHFMLLVVAPEAMLDDANKRSFHAYQALKNRIWDDVRDKDRANPYAPMVRIAAVGGDAE